MVRVRQFVNSILSSVTYLLTIEESRDCWLVDCGDTDDLLRIIQKEHLELKGIFLSHAHFDHIYGINTMLDKFPEAKIVTTTFGKMALESDKLNLSRYHEHPFVIKHKDCFNLVDSGVSLSLNCITQLNSVVLWPSITSRIFYTPGHNPSCLVFDIENKFFTGDAYIPETKVVTNIPKADKEVARDIYLKIEEMCKGHLVFSGHWIEKCNK